MTAEQRPKQPCVKIHGAWTGDVGHPKRVFNGKVTESTVTSILVGTKVKVTYHAPAQRTTDVTEHGTYTLHAGTQELKLMSFINMTEKTGGKQDTEAEDWQATPLPQ